MMRIPRMLLHKFPLTYSIDKGNTHLLNISRAAVPLMRAVVPPHPPQQQLLQLLHHLKDSTWSLSLNKKRLKVQKKNKEVLSIQGYVKLYNGITPLTTSLGAFERG
jgi:hypothetical protein